MNHALQMYAGPQSRPPGLPGETQPAGHVYHLSSYMPCLPIRVRICHYDH